MSINSMANAATARRPDFPPYNSVPKGISEIAAASGAPQPQQSAALPGQETTALARQSATTVNTALNLLFGYIPTEIITLYVAVLAATHQPNGVTLTEWVAFWFFLGATPIVVWLVYGAKLKAAEKPLPVAPRTWPMWEMIAATVAYCAWAFALPETPFSRFGWYSAALSGMAVLVTSTFLGLLAPLFQLSLDAGPSTEANEQQAEESQVPAD
jgi:hypothetical protein